MNLYFKKNNLEEYCKRFEVKMQPPIGPEDTNKSDLANNAMTRANDIISLLDSLGVHDTQVKINAIKSQLDVIDSSIYNLINGIEVDETEDEETSEENPFV